MLYLCILKILKHLHCVKYVSIQYKCIKIRTRITPNMDTFGDSHRLLLNLMDKINLKGSDKHVVLSNLGIYYAWNNI